MEAWVSSVISLVLLDWTVTGKEQKGLGLSSGFLLLLLLPRLLSGV